jgi:SAM-dependent methyltransferase
MNLSAYKKSQLTHDDISINNRQQADSKMSNDYYQAHSAEYHEQTAHIDPTSFLEPLAKHLQPGSRILDVGCGSGRDLLWFKHRGFDPTGLERSPGLARLARNHSGCDVTTADFETFDFACFQVDAVILAASLVHVPNEKLGQVLRYRTTGSFIRGRTFACGEFLRIGALRWLIFPARPPSSARTIRCRVVHWCIFLSICGISMKYGCYNICSKTSEIINLHFKYFSTIHFHFS